MGVDEALTIVDTALSPERLSALQEVLFRQCWAGETYQKIAEVSDYDPDYVRMVGAKLWRSLSDALGEKVTKNNVRAVLRQRGAGQTSVQTSGQISGQTSGQTLGSGALSHSHHFPGGPLPVDSPLYVERPPIEELAFAEILKPGALLRIRAPEKWGKTSLMERTLMSAEQQGYHQVRLNFQQAETRRLENLDPFLRWFCANLTQQLQLDANLDQFWDEDLGSKVSCSTYIQAHILSQLDAPLVVALDNVQRIFEYPSLAQDFLPLLRVWHEEAKNLASWAKLRLVVVYSTEVYIPLQVHQSPFNVGLPLRLNPLSWEQTQSFMAQHGLFLQQEAEQVALKELWRLVEGHPYLLALAFYYRAQGGVMFADLVQKAAQQDSIYSEHLRGHLAVLRQHPELVQTFTKIIQFDGQSLDAQSISAQSHGIGEPDVKPDIEPDAITTHRLESMGLVKVEGDRVTPRCDLYSIYFRDHLKAAAM